MTQKYTILKVLIQNLSKERHSNKGFTLIELIVGMVILVSIIGLAMNAFISASSDFNKDKKTIESSQSLSAVLELIGSDIRQAGEQINDAKFPVIKIEYPNPDSGSMANSSKITVRRALSTALTLCQDVTGTSLHPNLIVAEDALAVSGCNSGALTTTTTPSAVTRPDALRKARDTRCKLDNVNGDYTSDTTDFCDGVAAESVLAMMLDGSGNTRTFRYTDDTQLSPTKYQITIANLSSSTPNNAATYTKGSASIYLIEERIYILDDKGNLKLTRDGGNPETLIKRMDRFKVTARVYGDKKTKEPDAIDPASTIAGTKNVLPLSRRCNNPPVDPPIPYYVCDFNTTTADDWKTLQGVKVELRAKDDGTGQSTNDEKRSASAEFFPRNVLSK